MTSPAQEETQELTPPQKPTRKSPYSSLLPIFIVGLIMLMVGVTAGYFLFAPKTNVPTAEETSTNHPTVVPTQPIGETCSPYGVTTIQQDFLPTYSVTSGDTPTTIIAKQFGSSLRVKEFMQLNNLESSATDSALTQGLTVLLPPKEVDSTSGMLFAATGQLKRIEDNTYWLKTRTINSEQGDYPLNTNSQTKILKTPKIGDCVKAVIQLGSDNQVYFITTY